jgi:hypothetical protein
VLTGTAYITHLGQGVKKFVLLQDAKHGRDVDLICVLEHASIHVPGKFALTFPAQQLSNVTCWCCLAYVVEGKVQSKYYDHYSSLMFTAVIVKFSVFGVLTSRKNWLEGCLF